MSAAAPTASSASTSRISAPLSELSLVFAKTGLETLKKRALSTIDDLVGVLPSPQVSWGKIN
nr:hypothetical protein [uncultured Prevotella sp.]